MASAILNPGHDENAKPEAAPTTLKHGSPRQEYLPTTTVTTSTSTH